MAAVVVVVVVVVEDMAVVDTVGTAIEAMVAKVVVEVTLVVAVVAVEEARLKLRRRSPMPLRQVFRYGLRPLGHANGRNLKCSAEGS